MFKKFIYAFFGACILTFALTACGDDNPDSPNDTLENGDNNQGGAGSQDLVGCYIGDVFSNDMRNYEYEQDITLQLNSDRSGYFLETYQDGCKSYLHFTDWVIENDRFWIKTGDNKWQELGKPEEDGSDFIKLNLENTGYSRHTNLRRINKSNDFNNYSNVESYECNHFLEVGNVIGCHYEYASWGNGYSRRWFLKLNIDNTFESFRNQNNNTRLTGKGVYTVSGHTIRLYFDEKNVYYPYNLSLSGISNIMMEDSDYQYLFQRISEADFNKWCH